MTTILSWGTQKTEEPKKHSSNYLLILEKSGSIKIKKKKT